MHRLHFSAPKTSSRSTMGIAVVRLLIEWNDWIMDIPPALTADAFRSARMPIMTSIAFPADECRNVLPIFWSRMFYHIRGMRLRTLPSRQPNFHKPNPIEILKVSIELTVLLRYRSKGMSLHSAVAILYCSFIELQDNAAIGFLISSVFTSYRYKIFNTPLLH